MVRQVTPECGAVELPFEDTHRFAIAVSDSRY
jgi:hypothetical protein